MCSAGVIVNSASSPLLKRKRLEPDQYTSLHQIRRLRILLACDLCGSSSSADARAIACSKHTSMAGRRLAELLAGRAAGGRSGLLTEAGRGRAPGRSASSMPLECGCL